TRPATAAATRTAKVTATSGSTAKGGAPAKRPVREPAGLKSGSTAPTSSKPLEISVGTDAAFAPSTGQPRRQPKNISDVRHFFRTNDAPILFFGPTPFTLPALDRWIRNFPYVTYYDAWDGAHPRVFTPTDKPYQEFESGEEINNWLLTNHEVRAHIDSVTP